MKERISARMASKPEVVFGPDLLDWQDVGADSCCVGLSESDPAPQEQRNRESG